MNGKKVFTLAAALILLAAGLPTGAARADILIVNTTGDINDAGLCTAIQPVDLPGPDGVISLREALCAANNHTGSDTIAFDIPGSGVQTIYPLDALPVIVDDETIIDGYAQPGSAPATETSPASLLIELDCSHLIGYHCLEIQSAYNRVSGLVINRAGVFGIAITGTEAVENVISGNYIGTDPLAETRLPNLYGGVFITMGASDNLIGGDQPAERNILSGNGGPNLYQGNGVVIQGADTSGNTISANYIGVDDEGDTRLTNTLNGIHLYGGTHDNLIGGDTPGERNVISGNGIITGTEGMGGILLEGVSQNTISGNYIGMNAAGTDDIYNFAHGIILEDSAENVIGGTSPGEENVISGNANYGILIMGEASDSNLLTQNFIGTGPGGVGETGYQQVGVEIVFGPDMTVLEGGVVAYHSMMGVDIYHETTAGNIVIPDSIFANDYGINLNGGANGNILPPEITNVELTGGMMLIQGYSQPGDTITVYGSTVDEGQGERLIGSAVADGTGNWNLNVTPVVKRYFNATATTISHGTSEFSATFEFVWRLIFLPVQRR